MRNSLTKSRCCKQSAHRDIRLAVRDSYAQAVSKRSCCKPNSDLSFGCGDPTLTLNLEFQKSPVILDLGCGAGYDLAKVGRSYASRGLVLGVDMTKEMIVRARERVREQSLSNVEFVLADISYLPIRSSCADAAISNCVINLTKSKVAVFKELSRVVKKRGAVVVSDIVTEQPLPEDYRRDAELWSRCLSGAITQRSYLRALSVNGFSAKILSKVLWKEHTGYRFYAITISAIKV